jgi:hypothetical protein
VALNNRVEEIKHFKRKKKGNGICQRLEFSSDEWNIMKLNHSNQREWNLKD